VLGNNNYKKLDNKFTIQGNRKLRSEEIQKKKQTKKYMVFKLQASLAKIGA